MDKIEDGEAMSVDPLVRYLRRGIDDEKQMLTGADG